MRSNGYTLQIACCASCHPCKEIPPSKGWVGGYIKRVPPLPFWLRRAPSPKGSGRIWIMSTILKRNLSCET